MSDILGHVLQQLAFLPDAIRSLALAATRPDWLSIHDIDVSLTQHSLSRAIDEASFDALLASAPNLCSSTLALSSAIRHAGDWLNVVPSPALGLHLHDQEFHFCLLYWLGLQMFGEGLGCPVCQVDANLFGDH